VSWSRRFDEPIPPPNGKKLRTLKDAIARLATEVPKAEQARALADCHRDAAVRPLKGHGVVMFADLAMRRALAAGEAQGSASTTKENRREISDRQIVN
jgi:hypothetical protein